MFVFLFLILPSLRRFIINVTRVARVRTWGLATLITCPQYATSICQLNGQVIVRGGERPHSMWPCEGEGQSPVALQVSLRGTDMRFRCKQREPLLPGSLTSFKHCVKSLSCKVFPWIAPASAFPCSQLEISLTPGNSNVPGTIVSKV